MERSILFICTGNYYRSRFAEIMFNTLCKEKDLNYQAYSRGLRLSSLNEGMLSPHTVNYMKAINMDIQPYMRMPLPIEHADFRSGALAIAMDETEHRPLMQELFPEYINSIQYWSFADDYIEQPQLVLPRLEQRIHDFVNELANLNLTPK